MKQTFLKVVIPILFLSSLTDNVVAQLQNDRPIKWQFSAIRLNENEAKLVFTANLEDGWHVYSQFLDDGGPMPTAFTFVPDPSYDLKGKVIEESTPVKSFDNVFMMDIVWFKKTAVFTQVVKLKSAKTKIHGKVEYMGCNDFMCLPPNEESFSIEVQAKLSDKNSKGE